MSRARHHTHKKEHEKHHADGGATETGGNPHVFALAKEKHSIGHIGGHAAKPRLDRKRGGIWHVGYDRNWPDRALLCRSGSCYIIPQTNARCRAIARSNGELYSWLPNFPVRDTSVPVSDGVKTYRRLNRQSLKRIAGFTPMKTFVRKVKHLS